MRIGFTGHLRKTYKKPFFLKHSSRIDPCNFCLSQAYARIVKLQQRYRITARVNSHMVALKLNEGWVCTLKCNKEIDNRHWAVLTIEWEGKDPSLTQLDAIKEDFLGKDTITMLILQPALKPCTAIIVHCIGDYFLPGQS